MKLLIVDQTTRNSGTIHPMISSILKRMEEMAATCSDSLTRIARYDENGISVSLEQGFNKTLVKVDWAWRSYPYRLIGWDHELGWKYPEMDRTSDTSWARFLLNFSE